MVSPTFKPIIEARDGLLIDIETGEIVGVVAPDGGELHDKPEQPAAFAIDCEEKANWVLGKILKRDAAIAAANLTLSETQGEIKAKQDAALAALEATPEMIELRAIEANCMRIGHKAEREKEGLIARFAYELKLYAQQRLEGAKARTLGLAFGSLSLRKTGGNLTIADPERFTSWALNERRFDLVKATPLVSKIGGELEESLRTDPEVREHLGVQVEPVDDTLKISTGVGK